MMAAGAWCGKPLGLRARNGMNSLRERWRRGRMWCEWLRGFEGLSHLSLSAHLPPLLWQLCIRGGWW